jgi:alanine-synthesizing transaminase
MGSWLAKCGPLQREIRERARGNLAALQRIAAARPGDLQVLRTDAGWSAVLTLPACVGEGGDCAERLVRERGVVVHPGSFYAMAGRGRVVVSLIGPPEDLADGIQAAIA